MIMAASPSRHYVYFHTIFFAGFATAMFVFPPILSKSRQSFRRRRAAAMRFYASHNMPPGCR
jgi:hypothetical protein